MRRVTKDWLENGNDHSFWLIGDNDRQKYYPAIIGIARDNSHVVYSYDKLVKCFMKANEWSWEEAVEWVDYNVERALPYYGSGAPKLLMNKFIHTDNKAYEPIKVVDK